MRMLVVLIVLAAVVAGIVLLLRARARPASPPPLPAPVDPLRDGGTVADPRAIKVGDVVAWSGRDFIVRGTLELEEGGFRWHEHLLDDVEIKRWLTVEDDEDLELTLFQAVPAPELLPGPPSLEYDGVTWTRTEHGQAGFTAVGTTGTGPAGRVEYYDYASGSRRLAFERWGSGSWEVSVGEVIPPAALDLYPSSS